MKDAHDQNTAILLQYLESQYRLFREELRAFMGAATALATVLVAIAGAFAFAPEQTQHRTIRYLLVPLGALSLGALVGLLYIYMDVAAIYCERLESRMNALLRAPVFTFEKDYGIPKKGKGERLPFYSICVLIASTPIAVTLYGMSKLAPLDGMWKFAPRVTAWLGGLLLAIVVLGAVVIIGGVLMIRRSKEKVSAELSGDAGK